MKRLLPWIILLAIVTGVAALPALAAMQTTGVTAEAIGQANLRARPDVESELVGQIAAGTRYTVLGRSEFFPWYLLGDPGNGQPLGWVFAELVTVQGNSSLVPISTAEVGATPFTPAPSAVENAPPAVQSSPTQSAPTPTPTLTAAVTGTVLGEVNIRYGPGVNSPRLGVAQAGAQFEITRYHTQMPWVEIRYPGSPDGIAWVALDLLTIQGDLYSLPSTSRTDFNLPTLTPTRSAVEVVAVFGEQSPSISPAFQALGDQIWTLMQDAGFELGTSRPGAFFLMDLQTGEAVTFGNQVAFSGMSINKIAILARLYGELNAPPDNDLAVTIAEAMICSENISTNKMLATIGGGSPFRGAREVTTFLQNLGLNDTFMTAPFANDPFITPEAAGAPTTNADQRSAQPDLFNQMTVDDMGILLADMYQCAYQDRGPLLEQFDGQYTARECRQMLHAMSGNKINALFESGVPLDTRIAHKHGWINDTHGNAGIIFTPGGDYVLVAVVHNPVWMDYNESFPLLAEISREVYNFYNPDDPVAEIRDGDGAEECHLLGNPLIQDLMSSTYDE